MESLGPRGQRAQRGERGGQSERAGRITPPPRSGLPRPPRLPDPLPSSTIARAATGAQERRPGRAELTWAWRGRAARQVQEGPSSSAAPAPSAFSAGGGGSAPRPLPRGISPGSSCVGVAVLSFRPGWEVTGLFLLALVFHRQSGVGEGALAGVPPGIPWVMTRGVGWGGEDLRYPRYQDCAGPREERDGERQSGQARAPSRPPPPSPCPGLCLLHQAAQPGGAGGPPPRDQRTRLRGPLAQAARGRGAPRFCRAHGATPAPRVLPAPPGLPRRRGGTLFQRRGDAGADLGTEQTAAGGSPSPGLEWDTGLWPPTRTHSPPRTGRPGARGVRGALPPTRQVPGHPAEEVRAPSPHPAAKFTFVLAITSCLVSAGNQTGPGRDPPPRWTGSPGPRGALGT